MNTLNSTKRKHHQSQPAYERTFINGEPPIAHSVIFDDINKVLVRRAAIRTKGWSGTSGLDADVWRKMLTLKVFGSCTSDFRKTIADFMKNICIKEIEFQNNTTSRETFIASN